MIVRGDQVFEMTTRNKEGSVFYNFAAKLIDLIYKIINKNIDVPSLQKKYNATRETVLEIYITHTPRPTKPPKMEFRRYFKIKDGRAIMMNEAEPNATVWCELHTMINMIKGEVTREHEGRKWKENYTPLDAWGEGKLTVTSPGKTESGWLSDMELLSREIYSQVFPVIRREIGNKFS